MSADTIEMLQQRLQGIVQPQERANILCSLSENTARGNPHQAYKFASEALALAEDVQDKHLQGLSHFYIATSCISIGKTEEIMHHALTARAFFYDTDDLSMVHRCNTRLAIALNRAGRTQEAIDVLQEGLLYYRSAGDVLQEAYLLLMIGDMSRGRGKYPTALQYVLEALELYRKLDDLHGMGTCSLTLSSIYYEQNYLDMEKAIKYTHRYYTIMQSLGDIRGQMIALSRLGKLYAKEHKYNEALDALQQAELLSEQCGYFQEQIYRSYVILFSHQHYWEKVVHYALKAIPIVQQQNDQITLKYLFNDLGTAYIGLGNYQEAIDCATKALDIEIATGNGEIHPQVGYNSYSNLSEAYEQLGNTALALRYYKESVKYDKLTGDQEKQRIIAEMQAKFDVGATEREKELLRGKNAELTAVLDEVRRLNDNLAKVNNEKNEVLGIVAHDLKSPLSGVRMVASLVKEHYRRMPEVELEHQLDAIIDSTERMLSISASLLNAQKIEKGDMYGAPQQVDVSVVVQRIAESYRQAAEAKQIILEITCGESIELVCSQEALRQAVENIVSNAVKFTPQGKKITVRVRSQQKKVIVEVEDEGPGIRAQERKKLYGKYSRLSARPTGGESTTGLGLWIAKKAVEAMHGRIRCTSKVGSGTVFSIEVPCPS